ncbi:MAG: pyridoxamine 5'-phosphate oxidase family protein [Bradyrhizobium sp.]|nr:pyridoxamine 5'-phosphate oxidase family protein [Bradyrhizobium sp.]
MPNDKPQWREAGDAPLIRHSPDELTVAQISEHDKDALKIWELIKNAHSAVLVTAEKDGSLDSGPMGCIQRAFDGTIWFFTFADSKKIDEIADIGSVQL